MPSKDKMLERRNFFGDRISNQVRLIAVGILVTIWTLLTGTISLSNIKEIKANLIVVAIICLLSLLLDFIQYVFAYINIKRALSKMERNGSIYGKYKNDWLYKTANWFFWAKQVCLGIAVLIFLFSVTVLVWQPRTSILKTRASHANQKEQIIQITLFLS